MLTREHNIYEMQMYKQGSKIFLCEKYMSVAKVKYAFNVHIVNKS